MKRVWFRITIFDIRGEKLWYSTNVVVRIAYVVIRHRKHGCQDLQKKNDLILNYIIINYNIL